MTDTNYVDNKRFYECMVERKEQLKTDPDLPISPEIAQIIMDIAYNLQFHRKFIKYPYKEELVGDAIENCIRYLDNFDSEEYDNPFAYFTQISWWAFVRRIKKEYKQKDLKESILDNMADSSDSFSVQAHDMNEHYSNSSLDFEQNKDDFSRD